LQQFCFKYWNLIKELELSEVPDDISCTEKLQKWNVPATGNEMKSAAFCEDLLFEQGGFDLLSKANGKDI
jgi:hypothetical protein